MFEPTNGTELLNYASSDYPDILLDIRGRERAGGTKLPGASHVSGLVNRQMPKKCNVGVSFSINNLLTQTITFPSFPVKVVGVADFSPNANATSGLVVSYSSSNPSVATVVNGQIHLVGIGTSYITASQIGNTAYNPAHDVTQLLTVTSTTATQGMDADVELFKIFPKSSYKSNKCRL